MAQGLGAPAIYQNGATWLVSHQNVARSFSQAERPGAYFSKVPKLFGSISGVTIPFISSQRRGSKPSNFVILLVFLKLKTCLKINFSKQVDCSLTTGFSGPKSSRDFEKQAPTQDQAFHLWRVSLARKSSLVRQHKCVAFVELSTEPSNSY